MYTIEKEKTKQKKQQYEKQYLIHMSCFSPEICFANIGEEAVA